MLCCLDVSFTESFSWCKKKRYDELEKLEMGTLNNARHPGF